MGWCHTAQDKGDPGTRVEHTGKSRIQQETPSPEDHSGSSNPWEAQVGWCYTGHGEWTSIDRTEDKEMGQLQLQTEPRWAMEQLASQDRDIWLHQEVRKKGYPNRWGAKIPVSSTWNLELFRNLLTGYKDQEIVEWLKYGWPTGRIPTLPSPGTTAKNHKGATDYPEQLDKYIKKEAQYGAVMGPYHKIPFQDNIGISPLSTRPKKQSEERRVILDLSFPIGEAVNDGIPKDTYMGFKAELAFPKTDEFALPIFDLGPGCLLFKIDLSKYFRQIPLDPGDYSLIGYIINGEIYFDKVLPMSMRSAPYIA